MGFVFLFFLAFQWKKHWFVLTDQTLRYYKDSIAEEVRLVIHLIKKIVLNLMKNDTFVLIVGFLFLFSSPSGFRNGR